MVSKPTGRLAVVATPIGNLGDVSPRAAQTLAEADLVVCEDSRVTGRLLQHLDLHKPMLAYHDHNAAQMRPRLLAALGEGKLLALVSDAGTPGISDPGHKLVREAAEAGFEIVAVPGPSAVVAALSIAGLPTDRFLFAGFLPSRAAARRAALEELRAVPATLVLYEAPQRVAECLADAAAVLGPRPAALARELTKRFEEVRRGDLAGLAAEMAAGTTPKGEMVLVIGRADTTAVLDDAAVDAALAEALATCGPSEAAAAVAAMAGRPRREVYARALALKAAAPG
ncbi:MAG TPA: 16S rRNA (cytidine(1402)-2'-O)-methyltransferase [Geminicoccaceae bacterium]|nr:16S rRNA (cytidine(1402)-2'-O)-methyltransferase [Geminicoccus sp.]HMU48854.1 16S rRNA (cytidine(1402)-2'-O)-methyltransferase [Geminicoccaceae bacterium]